LYLSYICFIQAGLLFKIIPKEIVLEGPLEQIYPEHIRLPCIIMAVFDLVAMVTFMCQLGHYWYKKITDTGQEHTEELVSTPHNISEDVDGQAELHPAQYDDIQIEEIM